MGRAKEVSFVNKSKSARFITRLCNNSEKSQIEIADEVGFDKPNIITMIKQGRIKIPVPRIPALAKALDTDPGALLDMVLEENHPELRDVLLQIQGVAIDSGEKRIISLFREVKVRQAESEKVDFDWDFSKKNIERLQKLAIAMLKPAE